MAKWAINLQLFAQEKTEKATPKKQKEARDKGQVAKSSDLPGAMIMLFCFFALFMMGGYYTDGVHELFMYAFKQMVIEEFTMDHTLLMMNELMMKMMILLLPIMFVAMVVAFLGNYIQIGLLFTTDPLKMKLEKINMLKGFKKIFSLRSLVEFFKSIFKISIIGLIVYLILLREKDHLLALSTLPLGEMLEYIGGLTLMLGLLIGAMLVILGWADFFYQRYEHNKSLKMSKQDIKDEYKKSEGDPQIKAKIRERQRRMAMQRMMQEVPKADVIITNPTHYAVAIQYDGTRMEAPVVLAKGQDYVALKIKEMAKEHHILTMENKPLARALYAQVEIGEAIPADLFQAVAEVLAYVYKLKNSPS
ncbi:flagellar biosynthesis protein FlhB [Marinicrinis sediminis]|uniref:Flagellar biosynthetic protein FlhB n=1 Tax=Marinicrinis sediminis TaxID=1652465 RepID=A0ABW5R508_9BACL